MTAQPSTTVTPADLAAAAYTLWAETVMAAFRAAAAASAQMVRGYGLLAGQLAALGAAETEAIGGAGQAALEDELHVAEDVTERLVFAAEDSLAETVGPIPALPE